MRSKYYDVVYFGGQIGGLLSAISLLKKGIKVLMIEGDDYFYPFDKHSRTNNSVTYFGGFTLRNLMKSLGFHPLDINKLTALDPSIQVIMPGIRFDLYSDEKRLLGELKREFPDIWGEANTLFAKMSEYQDLYPKLFMSRIKFPPENFIERFKFRKFTKKIPRIQETKERSLDELLGSVGKNPDFKVMFESIVKTLSDLDTGSYSMPYISQIMNTARFDGYEFEEGLKGFHEILLKKFKDRGGIILDKGELKEISISGRFVDSIKLEGHSIDKIILSYFVINGNPASILKYIPQRKNFLIKRKLSKIKQKFVKYSFYLKLKSTGYPVGMNNRVILIKDPKKELCGSNLLYLNRVAHGKEQSNEESLTLAVTSHLKPEEFSSADFTNSFKESCKNIIREIIPFMDDHILSIEAPSVNKSEFGDDLRSSFVYENPSSSWFGVTALPYTTYLKNLFFVGQSVFPGLGFDGEIQSGLKVSRHISDSFKVKKP